MVKRNRKLTDRGARTSSGSRQDFRQAGETETRDESRYQGAVVSQTPREFRKKGPKSAKHRRGFSLIEVVVSTLLVGLLLVGALRTFSGSVQASDVIDRQAQAVLLADELMAEILRQAYEPSGDATASDASSDSSNDSDAETGNDLSGDSGLLGGPAELGGSPESGATVDDGSSSESSASGGSTSAGTPAATNRSPFDDVDDYKNWTASPPQTKAGSVRSELSGWTRSVMVDLVDPDNLTSVMTTDAGVKRVTVTVEYNGEVLTVLHSLHTRAWINMIPEPGHNRTTGSQPGA